MQCSVMHHSHIMQQHLTTLLRECGIEADISNDDAKLILIDDTVPEATRAALAEAGKILILCTAHHNSATLEHALANHVSDVIMLPCDSNILRSKLAHLEAL